MDRRKTIGEVLDEIAVYPPLIIASPTESLKVILKRMHKHRIQSVPIMEEGRCIGRVSILDIARFFVESDEYRNLDISARRFFERQTSGPRCSPECIAIFPESMRVEDTIKLFAAGCHRILVRCGESDFDLVNFSQSTLLRFFFMHSEYLPTSFKEQPLNQLADFEKLKGKLVSVREDDNALECLKILVNSDVLAVPVRDSEGCMVTTFSVSDLRMLTPRMLKTLDRVTIGSFCQGLRFKGRYRKSISITDDQTIEEAARRICMARVHRLWVTDGKKSNPIGSFSGTDFFRAFVRADYPEVHLP